MSGKSTVVGVTSPRRVLMATWSKPAANQMPPPTRAGNGRFHQIARQNRNPAAGARQSTINLPFASLAQSTYGTILGTVIDPTGASIPRVAVTVTNQGEDISRTVIADELGNYEVLNLKAGVFDPPRAAPPALPPGGASTVRGVLLSSGPVLARPH